MVTEGTTTAEVFIDFCQRLLHDADGPVYLIVDGHPAHRAKATKEFVASTDGQLTLDAGTGEDAQAEEAIVAALRGEDIVVAFNPTFLSEGLNSFNTDFVRFSFTSAPKPAMLTGQKKLDEDDQDQYRYLVMPVRLPNSN